MTGSALSHNALVRGADDDYTDDDGDDNNNAKFTECILCARDTVSTFCISHSSQLPCFPISQMRNGGT